MSRGTKTLSTSRLLRALARWPVDTLRPNLQLQNVLSRRLNEAQAQPSPADGPAYLQQANALYSLLENRYQSKYKPSDLMLRPRSRPTYYTDLVTELEEAPRLTWLGRLNKRLRGMVRRSYAG